MKIINAEKKCKGRETQDNRLFPWLNPRGSGRGVVASFLPLPSLLPMNLTRGRGIYRVAGSSMQPKLVIAKILVWLRSSPVAGVLLIAVGAYGLAASYEPPESRPTGGGTGFGGTGFDGTTAATGQRTTGGHFEPLGTAFGSAFVVCGVLVLRRSKTENQGRPKPPAST